MTPPAKFVIESLKDVSRVGDWITFPACGVVQLTSGKVDIGQGISTALAQICAEELGVKLERVRVVAPSTAHSPNEAVTSGSFSVQHSGNAIRRACATLRHAALGRCAGQWNVARAAVGLVDGTFTGPEAGQQASYWDLKLDEVVRSLIDHDAKGLPAQDCVYVGADVARLDLPGKVFGTSKFIQDLVFPGMLHGRVVRFPNRFARLRSVRIDATELAERCSGALLVQDGDFLGVIAPREDDAIKAAVLLAQACDWDMPAAHPEAGMQGFLRQAPAEPTVAAQRGARPDPAAAQWHATYSREMVAHASIGPSCAIAQWTHTGLDVWSHSQGIFNLRDALGTFVARLHPERAGCRLEVHHAEGAGCYGHNPADDAAFDAVLLSRAAQGAPVRVVWSRSDELGCGPYGSAQVIEIAATLDEEGNIASWHQQHWANGYTLRPGRHGKDILTFTAADQLANPFEMPVSFDPPLSVGGGSDRNAEPQYAIPCLYVQSNRLLEMPVRTSALRALGAHPNVFAIESFMDELAHKSGQDPVEFRLRHLDDERAKAVIRAALDDAPWWGQPRAEGEGHGIGYARYKQKGAWCAVAVRLLAEEAVRVTEVSVAVDVGRAVNPDGVRNQIEGGVIQACSWTLKEAVRFNEREITTRSWEDYPILQFSEAPVVRARVLQREQEESVGAGEAAMGPTAAAIANAVYDALGVRARHMPITPERLLEQLAGSV